MTENEIIERGANDRDEADRVGKDLAFDIVKLVLTAVDRLDPASPEVPLMVSRSLRAAANTINSIAPHLLPVLAEAMPEEKPPTKRLDG